MLQYNESLNIIAAVISFLPLRVNRKHKLLETIPKLSPSYRVRFDFNPSQFQDGWTNVIHLTTGGNCCGYGDRVPAVWFHGSPPSATKNRLHICSAVNGKGNYCYNSGATVARGQWTTMEISQRPEGSSYRYTVTVGGDILGSVINAQPRTFFNVKVFSADNWYNAAQGSIRNLVINPGVPGNFENGVYIIFCGAIDYFLSSWVKIVRTRDVCPC